MTNKPLNFASDLIATANPELAKKINKNNNLEEKKQGEETPNRAINDNLLAAKYKPRMAAHGERR